MRHIATDVALSVCLYVCLSVTTISCAKTDEPIEMLFGVWTRVFWGRPLRCGLSSEFFDHLFCVQTAYLVVGLFSRRRRSRLSRANEHLADARLHVGLRVRAVVIARYHIRRVAHAQSADSKLPTTMNEPGWG